MKKRSSIFILLILISVAACFLVKGKMKPSYLDDKLQQKLSYVTTAYDAIALKDGNDTIMKSTSMYHNEYTSYEDLMAHADVVVQVSYVSHEQDGEVLNTKVQVEKVYKGNAEKEIYVYEPSYVTSDSQMITQSAYLPMIQSKKYVLFLNEEEAITICPQYNLISSFFGKYTVSDALNIGYMDTNEITYTELKEKDFIKVDISEYKETALEEDKRKIQLYEQYRDHDYEQVWNQVKNLWTNE